MEEQKATPAVTPRAEGESVGASAPAPQKAVATAPKSFGVASDTQRKDRATRGGRGDRGGRGRGAGGKDGKRGGGRGRGDRPRQEYDQKSIDVRRVARVVAGGRRFSFSVAMIVGDRKGKVGVGTGKAGDISLAMDKAGKDAKKHLVTLMLTKTNSIPHQVMAKSSSAVVEIIPAPSRGLVAGSAVRNVLELAGVTDVSAKIRSGSKNKLNMARATLKALAMIRSKTKTTTVSVKEETTNEQT
ncbi:MAG: 30S ribosomal protein S5 [bacterium]|nr:30S ribosomal protein S5 [bacterium]